MNNLKEYGCMRSRKFAVMGIRFIDGEDGLEGGDEPPEYEPPTGEEPWAKYLENVPEVLQPEMVGAFRELSSNYDKRIETLTPYEDLASQGIPADEALMSHQFAQMLYGVVDPNDPAATVAANQQRLNFFNTYKEILETSGVLTKAEVQQQQAAAAAQVEADRQFETEEQKQLREMREELAALKEGQAQTSGILTAAQQQQAQAEQYQQLTSAYGSEWEGILAAHGQLSKREFQLVSAFANSDPDDNPGVITRAFNKLLSEYGRIPDDVPKTNTPKPPVLSPAGQQQLAVPPGKEMRFGRAEGRHNRQEAALEAIALLQQDQ